MLEFSLGGLIGAIVGTALAAATYGMLIDFIEERLLLRDKKVSGDRTSRQELALLRRGILAVDLTLFCGIGYVLGDHFVG
jgi:hypothetical protein